MTIYNGCIIIPKDQYAKSANSDYDNKPIHYINNKKTQRLTKEAADPKRMLNYIRTQKTFDQCNALKIIISPSFYVNERCASRKF